MTQLLIIPGTLPALNDILRVKASRWRGKWNEMKKREETRIGWEIRRCGIVPVWQASFSFLWIEPNKRRDPDNICAGGRKLILDSLVNCGILGNDGWNEILGWSDRWAVDKKNPRIEVAINPKTNQGKEE